MYPMKMIPVEKEALWGGDKLCRYGGTRQRIAECWVLSCHETGPSRVANGLFRGEKLKEVLTRHPEWIGTENPCPGKCPVLIKLIDAGKPLSVQVHPSDETAAAGEQGKAEMWYILDAAPGAFIYYGLKKTLTVAELKAHAGSGMICRDLNRVTVQSGDHYFIAPGTIHALGGGVLLAEVQQNSDTTFRLYDYGRRDAAGKLRPLHVERAAGVACRNGGWPDTADTAFQLDFAGFCLQGQTDCSCFRVALLTLEHSVRLDCGPDSFQGLLWLRGKAEIRHRQYCESLQPGACFFLPAGLGLYELAGEGRGLLVRL